MLTSRFIIKTCIHSLEERAACLPLIVFRELTPGLKACRAPLQHRPTAPNMVKMAEGEDALTAMLYEILYCSTAHAWSVFIPFLTKRGQHKPIHPWHRVRIFLISGSTVAATLMLRDDIAVVFVYFTRFLH